MSLLILALCVFVLNLPFGYWRANTTKFSLHWFLAVHLPVPLMIAGRIVAGLGWRLSTFPVLVGAFFLGQFMGARLHLRRKRREDTAATSCLFRDLLGTRTRLRAK